VIACSSCLLGSVSSLFPVYSFSHQVGYSDEQPPALAEPAPGCMMMKPICGTGKRDSIRQYGTLIMGAWRDAASSKEIPA